MLLTMGKICYPSKQVRINARLFTRGLGISTCVVFGDAAELNAYSEALEQQKANVVRV